MKRFNGVCFFIAPFLLTSVTGLHHDGMCKQKMNIMPSQKPHSAFILIGNPMPISLPPWERSALFPPFSLFNEERVTRVLPQESADLSRLIKRWNPRKLNTDSNDATNITVSSKHSIVRTSQRRSSILKNIPLKFIFWIFHFSCYEHTSNITFTGTEYFFQKSHIQHYYDKSRYWN